MTIRDNKENIRVLLYTMIAGQGVLLTHIASEASQKHGTTYRLTLEPKVCEFTEEVVIMKPKTLKIITIGAFLVTAPERPNMLLPVCEMDIPQQ